MLSFLRKNYGFTMLEFIIVVFVIIVGLIGAFLVAQHPITYIQPSFNQLTAAYLAQEGIEIVRNLRDENWLNKGAWNNGLPNGNWEVDYQTSSFNDNYDGDFLRIGNAGFYSYTGAETTKFKRKITIDNTNLPDYLVVKATIEWREKGGQIKSFIAQENLYPWWPY